MESTQPPIRIQATSGFPIVEANPAVRNWLRASGGFILLLLLLVAVAFPEVVAGSHTFFFRDFGLFGYPLAHYGRESFWRGELPLWNPLNDCGMPFLAQWNTMALYPLSVFEWLFPLSWSLGLFCLGHLVLAGVGMHRLARFWTGNDKAAALAGLTFAFNGLTLNSLMWPNNIAALGWMPWVVLMVETGVLRGGRTLACAAAVGALQMLTGAPEIIVFTWLLAGLLGIGRIAAGAASTNPSAADSVVVPWVKGITRLLLIVGLVASLAAIQLLPFLDMLWHSNRESMVGTSEWAMPIWGWANLVVPLFQTAPCLSEVPFQPGQYWTSSYYVGMATLSLAVWALCVQRHWRVRLLGGTVLLSLVLALGRQGYLYALAQKLAPGLAGLRYPVKFVVVAVFGLPLLAAYGVSLGTGPGQEQRPMRKRLLLGIGLATMVIALMLLILDRIHPLPGSDGWRIARSTVVGLTTLAIALGCIWKAPSLVEPRDQAIVWGTLLLAVWFDGLTHAPRQTPTAPRWIYDAHLVDGFLPSSPRPSLGRTRAMLSATTLETLHSTYIPDPGKYYPSRRAALYDNLNLLEAVPKIDGFYSMYLKEEAEIETLLYSRTNSYPARLADFLGVSQISSSTNLFRWESRSSAQPMLTGGQRPVFADNRVTMAGLGSESFDPREEVYLPLEAKAMLPPIKNSHVSIGACSFSAQRLEAEVKAEEPALVVIAQSFYHPWRCRIDGHPAHIWRANHAFQAIQVPPGLHSLRVEYHDTTLRAGAGLSLAALLGCGCLWRCKPRP